MIEITVLDTIFVLVESGIEASLTIAILIAFSLVGYCVISAIKTILKKILWKAKIWNKLSLLFDFSFYGDKMKDDEMLKMGLIEPFHKVLCKKHNRPYVSHLGCEICEKEMIEKR